MLKRLRLKTLFMLALLAGLLFLTAAACNTTIGPQTTSVPSPQPTFVPAKDVYQVGDRISVNTVGFTVLTVENSAGDKFATPAPGKILLLIRAQLDNLTREQFNYLLTEFTLTDASGRIYPSETEVEDMLGLVSIAPGNSLSGSIAFEIPETAKGLVLSWAPSFASRIIQVDLGR
jgi:hypothetical protein